MINEKEYRVGNLVYSFQSNPTEVNTTILDDLRRFSKNNQHYEDATPIPLTDEFLKNSDDLVSGCYYSIVKVYF